MTDDRYRAIDPRHGNLKEQLSFINTDTKLSPIHSNDNTHISCDCKKNELRYGDQLNEWQMIERDQ